MFLEFRHDEIQSPHLTVEKVVPESSARIAKLPKLDKISSELQISPSSLLLLLSVPGACI